MKNVAILASNFHFIFIFLDAEQSLAMQHFVGIYQDSLKVFSIEELRFVILIIVLNTFVEWMNQSAFVSYVQNPMN